MSETGQSDLNVAYHIVAFLDLLGQRDQLKQFTHIPPDDDEEARREFIRHLRETFGVVEGLTKLIETSFLNTGQILRTQGS